MAGVCRHGDASLLASLAAPGFLCLCFQESKVLQRFCSSIVVYRKHPDLLQVTSPGGGGDEEEEDETPLRTYF